MNGAGAGRAANSRKRILTAGTALFVRNGYHGTSMQELSEATGLGRGGLYHHIGSKEELLFKISLSLLIPVTDAASAVAQLDEEPEVKLRTIGRNLLIEHMEHGDAWSVALRETRALTPEHRKEIIAARDKYEAIWVAVLNEGTNLGIWKKVDGTEVRGMLGMFNAAAKWMHPDGELTPSEIADRFIDLLLGGMKT